MPRTVKDWPVPVALPSRSTIRLDKLSFAARPATYRAR
jgi:hypothetical protein